MTTTSSTTPNALKAEILERLKDRVLLLDGGMGSLLQDRGLRSGQAPEQFMLDRPEAIEEVHRAYYRAGSDMVLTNTFGASPLKLRDHGLDGRMEEINRLAVRLARKASGGQGLVAADIGPSGQFLKPIGSLNFDAAIWNFEEQVKALVKESPDAIIMETIADLREARAIAMAVRKYWDGLFIAQMTFTEDGNTVTGTDPLTALTVLESLGVDVFGANCSVGPEELLPVFEGLRDRSSLPLSVEPNAGMPELVEGGTVFPVGPEAFAGYGPRFVKAGVSLMGGCCGTTPDYIRGLRSTVEGLAPRPSKVIHTTRLASRFRTVEIDDLLPVRLLGERINPTARKKFRRELEEGVLTTVRKEAIRQEKLGASILDVNMGIGGDGEALLMQRAVALVQECSRLPVSLDSSSDTVLETGLREVAGKCLINSVNGEADKLEAVLPLVKRYGAAVLGLTLDERGIPETVDDRMAIAARIIEATDHFGIPRKDVFIDPLCLTVSSQQEQALHTLEAVRRLKKHYGVRTILGLSNISYGLPDRPLINRTFLTMALHAGLDVPIMNPQDQEITAQIRAADLILGRDPKGLIYIEKTAKTDSKAKKPAVPEGMPVKKRRIEPGRQLYEDVVNGDRDNILSHLDQVLATGEDPSAVNEKHLIPALLEVGRRFEKKQYYLPQVILAAEAMQIAFRRIKDLIPREDRSLVKGKVVLATVKGDVHDIGKNIVGAILETHGYEVTDLGKSVDAEAIANEAIRLDADLVGLSALMTTTMTEMKRVVDALRATGARAGVIIGGAVTTPAYAESIGADGHAADAMSAVPEVERILAARNEARR